MDDGVHLRGADDLGDQRVADVGPDELGPAQRGAQLPRRRHGVDPDDALDGAVGGQQGREPAAEVAADPGHENHGR
jgi:hypothetical protein